MKKWLVPTAVLASSSQPPLRPLPPLRGRRSPLVDQGLLRAVDLMSPAQSPGKVKNITTPSGEVISTSPGLKITLTGDESGKSVSYVITGVLFFSFPGDRIEVKATGVNLLQLPGDDGLILTKGNVNFALELDGITEKRRFSGSGTATNICPLLAP